MPFLSKIKKKMFFVSEDSLMTSRRCWVGVPASFTSTCGSTSASLPCWGCWQPPPSKCSSNTPLIWHGTKRRYGDLNWNGAYQYILMFYCRNIMLQFDWFIALDMFFLVRFVKGTWTLAAKRHVATCLEAPVIETPSLYLFLFVGGKNVWGLSR